MALLKYFKQIEPKKSEKIDAILPKTDGLLSILMPTSTIQAANKAIQSTAPNGLVYMVSVNDRFHQKRGDVDVA